MAATDHDDHRKESERQFHDTCFQHEARTSVDKYYAGTRASVRHFRAAVAAHCEGRRLLEYGCGPEPHALAIARQAASITGIDISPVAIERARERAAQEGHDNLTFVVMDAERLEFPDNYFDLVYGSAILHHLELETSVREIARVLKPDGVAVFYEPMGHNPAINLFRRATPAIRTPDEHPLKLAELDLLRRFFGDASFIFYHFLSLLAVPLVGRRMFERLLSGFDAVDRALFDHLPGAKRLAWFVVMTLERPNKSPTRSS